MNLVDYTNFHSVSSKNSFKRSLFKPIVASSLALLLGSTLYGNTEIQHPDCGDTSSCTPIDRDLTFKFGTGDSMQISTDLSTVIFSKEQKNVTLKDTNFTEGVFDFPGSTMTIHFENRSGNGNIENTGSNAKRIFNLEATNDFKGNLKTIGGNGNNEVNGTFHKNFTGNIDVVSHNGYSSAKVTLTFKGQENEAKDNQENVFTGNINVDSGTTTLNFENNGKIVGKIQANVDGFDRAGLINVNFKKNGAIEVAESSADSDVIVANYYSSGAKNTITFSGASSTNTIKGGILARRSGTNIITFSGASSINTITGNISSENSAKNNISFTNGNNNSITGTIQATRGTNTITFGNSGVDAKNSEAANIITGNIIAQRSSDAQGNPGNNTITFNSGTTNTIQGNITASASTNTITFNGTGVNKIEGGITAGSSTWGGKGTNTIAFNNGATNTIKGNISADIGDNIITFAGTATNSISGDIKAGGGGSNTITFNGTGSNNISGGISANGGTNTITFKSSQQGSELEAQTSVANTITSDITANGGSNKITMNGANIIAGNIKAGTGGATGNNHLYLSGASTQIGATSAVSIIAEQTSGYATDKNNLLVSQSSSNTFNLNELKANGYERKAKNIISLDDTATKTASTSNITIKTMAATNGHNYIGKGILASSSAENGVTLTDNTNSMSFVDATNAFVGNLSVSSVTSNNGVNNISFKASNTILASENAKATPQNAIIGSVILNNDEA
ncbi:beta strand repeat-containing protein, partial [Helicobacter sp. 'house sparrow 1']|uniref:beta strand repeat-containing protein n=1 Tax=Helicobacter sp. 'house sparrow 1' TaxID=2020247 RepID=UPI0013150848